MKRIIVLTCLIAAAVLALVLTVKPAKAQLQRPPFCHDELICTPYYGCRWVTICN